MSDDELVLGLDLGTGGARALVVSLGGRVVADGSASLASARAPRRDDGRHEQRPDDWWDAARTALGTALDTLDGTAHRRDALVALSVDGTSGSVLGLDADGRPTTPGLMYDDARGTAVADELRERAPADAEPAALAPTSALARLRWLEVHDPRAFAASVVFVHQADWIAGRLTGRHGVADASNALKTGYDLARRDWAAWLDGLPGLRARLPRVVEPGDDLGPVDPAVAADLGLPDPLRVVAGATDGTTGLLASGARQPGDDATTLGTTLVFKRVSRAPLRDDVAGIYSHALGGLWLPGAASNTGADWIRRDHPDADPAVRDVAAAALLPVSPLAYPLRTRGERFPFRSATARGFCTPATDDVDLAWAAHLQGTACIERLGYAALDRAAGEQATGAVHATGGGSASDLWLQLRADVCGRPFRRPARPESAFGAAVLAASGWHGDCWRASAAMVRPEREALPDASRHAGYSEYHERLVAELQRRGFLSSDATP